MRKKLLSLKDFSAGWNNTRSKIRPPSPASAPVIRVSNNIVHLGIPKKGPKPRQLLSLPPFPGHSLPGRNPTSAANVTAISWLRYYFNDIPPGVIQKHFNEGLVQIECLNSRGGQAGCYERQAKPMKKIRPNDVLDVGARVQVPVSVAECKISKRFDVIPRATLYPNADEIEYLQRLVKYKPVGET